jgi:hypothetical protein
VFWICFPQITGSWNSNRPFGGWAQHLRGLTYNDIEDAEATFIDAIRGEFFINAMDLRVNYDILAHAYGIPTPSQNRAPLNPEIDGKTFSVRMAVHESVRAWLKDKVMLEVGHYTYICKLTYYTIHTQWTTISLVWSSTYKYNYLRCVYWVKLWHQQRCKR